jgi:preprotein translocase subunit SecA
MTGTAATEAEEFHKIYNLDVVIIPTHRPMQRKDHADVVYKTTRAKYSAVVNEIAEAYKRGQPVLVGTTSIDKNEIISDLLRRKGVPHQVLNAKNHEKEAGIISEAGKKGAVTVATNMAGRGVDIILGGHAPATSDTDYKVAHKKWQKAHEEVQSVGGLHVIGTERHESRRIDNQLRGRAGRQGDPGSSRFFVSLEDDIMRLFGGDQVAKLMTMFKLPEDVPLEHGMVSRAIEQAQIKVEGFHFDSRKHLVEYDDVLNKQREIVYKKRRKILEGENFKEEMQQMLSEQLSHVVGMYAPEKGEIEREKIVQEFVSIVPFDAPSQQQLVKQLEQMHTHDEIEQFFNTLITDIYNQKEQQFSPEVMRQVERWVTLTTIDNLWMDHLDAIDDLREGIGLRGYAQRDPLVEYKNEAFSMFERLMAQIDYDVTHRIFHAQVQIAPQQNAPMQLNIAAAQKSSGDVLDSLKQTAPAAVKPKGSPLDKLRSLTSRNQPAPKNDLLSSLIKKDSKLVAAANTQLMQRAQTPASVAKPKLGRNDPCWCGSGRKFKKCHYPNTG